jgi:hypothetical protein
LTECGRVIVSNVRNINTDPNQNKVVGAFVNKYAINLSVDDFCNEGVVLKDRSGHKVAPAYGEIHGKMIHTGKPYAEIMVLGIGEGVLIGWIRADLMVDVGSYFMAPMKGLNKLPDSFNFVEECPHLSVYGGVYTEGSKGWECLNCGKVIVK